MKKQVFKAFYLFRTIIIRLIPVMIFMWLAIALATYIDYRNVQAAPGENYIDYTSFVVNNAREGDDVYFSVCRNHSKQYNVNGNLNVYIVSSKDSRPIQVFARDIQAAVVSDCENKQIPESEFHHTPAVYQMSFCVDFTVQYRINKTVCKQSNRYTIYPAPSDVNQRITYLEQQLSVLRAQRDAIADATASTQQSPRPASEPQETVVAQQPSTPPANDNESNTSEQCVANILGIKILCRQGV